MNILYILAAILMLGIMVTIHEAGHFFAARLTGIPVKEFAIGFGPQIFKWKSKKHETQFFLRAIPAARWGKTPRDATPTIRWSCPWTAKAQRRKRASCPATT